jgi:predicted ATPase/class 3 adenylate cyclase
MIARTLTFLMTDIQGSTRMWEEFPSTMPEVVRRHEAIILSAVTDHGGTVLKSKGEGDSTFSTFESPSQAVRAAVDAQARLAAEPWPAGMPLAVRMAIHTGEVQHREDDYYGPTINRCARIREIGHGGQVLVSNAVRELAHSQPGLSWVDHGSHRLRDLLRAERIWEVSAAGESKTLPKLRSLTVSRNNLPIQLTSFIGRKMELGLLGQLVLQNRLVNVIGFGGEGKTRLALQVAAELELPGPADVWFVALDSLRTGREIESAIIKVLGGEADTELNAETIERLGLRTSPALLILDNAEHLIGELRPIVEMLLNEAASLHLLITSRQPLHSAGEILFRVPGMSVPSVDDPSMEGLQRSEAGQLFLARAVARDSDFRLTAGTCKAVGDICRLLEGVPLAIEQAAPLVAIMSASQVLERLSNRLDWLSSEDPSVSDRHRSLVATIEWSYELLTEHERELFLMLSLFRGSFSLEAAAFMAVRVRPGDKESVALVRSLIDKSFLTRLYDHEDEVRFRLLETLRQFARDRLLDVAPGMDRYVAWCVVLTRKADDGFGGPEQSAWFDRCDLEQANVRKALEWCEENSDPRLLPIAFRFRKFWLQRGLYSEGRQWLERAYPLATQTTDPPSPAVANTLGAFAFRQYDHLAALAFYEEGLASFLKSGEKRLLPALYNNIAITLQDSGRISEAAGYFQRGILVSREIGDLETLTALLVNHAICQKQLGNWPEAEQSALDALHTADTRSSSTYRFLILATLCHIALERSRQAESASWALQGLTDCGQVHPSQLAELLIHVARLALGRELYESAARLVGGSEALLATTGPEHESDFLERRRSILVTIQEATSSTEAHSWKAKGRRATRDHLVGLAREVCESLSQTGTAAYTAK